MDATRMRQLLLDPKLQPILAILKGARAGLVYGAKVRAPHALVMTIIFHGGRPWSQRARFVYNATKQHALNLCKFVTLYKTTLLVQRVLAGGKERKADTFFAGLVGGAVVFGERNAVNEQIVLYVASRVMTSFLPRAAGSSATGGPTPKPPPSTPVGGTSMPPPTAGQVGAAAARRYPHPPGYPYPKSQPPDSKVFSLYAAVTWGLVMWLFRWRRETLHGGMVQSMQYLYLDSEVWDSLKTLLWHNKP